MEPLHGLENSLVTDCVPGLFEEDMTPKQKQELDFLVWCSQPSPTRLCLEGWYFKSVGTDCQIQNWHYVYQCDCVITRQRKKLA
jgi:hypothetical protein